MARVLLMAIVCSAAAFSADQFFTRPMQAAQAEKQNTLPATMPIPPKYREWIFLTSGLDMTYAVPGAVGITTEHHSVFDNVFVNPEAYRTFLKTGTWPDSTTFVLENRAGESEVSINKAGKTQGLEISGLEIHAKLHSEWAFYVRAKDGNERLVPRTASCYTCHEEHAAVDTTFVQFYPTLLPLAKEKHLLSAAYLHDPATKPAEK